MPQSTISQRRTQNLLLLQKLLNLRDGTSPFTLLLDNLEQSSELVVREFMLRSKVTKTKIVFVSFQTLRKPKHADVFITARRKPLGTLTREIIPYLSPPQSQGTSINKTALDYLNYDELLTLAETLLVFDSLLPLAVSSMPNLPAFFAGFISPCTSVLATYHTDVPVPHNTATSLEDSNYYLPDALTTLKYLATAILYLSNLSQTLERKRARDRSLEEPVFGLHEGRDGILVGRQTMIEERLDGIVLDMEVRRKSGRGVREVYVLFTGMAGSTGTSNMGPTKAGPGANICLLDDHPLYAHSVTMDMEGNNGGGDGEGEVETTFSLGLTEQQRRDRENVVLPYFDAQRGEGAGDGGKILYEMDRGDDFDEEEDEI